MTFLVSTARRVLDGVVFVAGVAYIVWYKARVLDKVT
jgi:hypothetical protein